MRAQTKYIIVTIDYFIKLVEAEPLAVITKAKTSNFIWKTIIFWFSIPYTIVINNEQQFDNERYK